MSTAAAKKFANKALQLFPPFRPWDDKQEANRHTDAIRKAFDSWTGTKLPLSVLRQIAALIDRIMALLPASPQKALLTSQIAGVK